MIRCIGIFGNDSEMKVRAGSTKMDFGIANPLTGGKLFRCETTGYSYC